MRFCSLSLTLWAGLSSCARYFHRPYSRPHIPAWCCLDLQGINFSCAKGDAYYSFNIPCWITFQKDSITLQPPPTVCKRILCPIPTPGLHGIFIKTTLVITYANHPYNLKRNDYRREQLQKTRQKYLDFSQWESITVTNGPRMFLFFHQVIHMQISCSIQYALPSSVNVFYSFLLSSLRFFQLGPVYLEKKKMSKERIKLCIL